MKLVKYSEFSIDNTYPNKATQFSTNNSYDDLDEETYEKYGLGDFWQDIKYGMSKLGRYKAGGKIFGKWKTDEEAAEKMKKIMAKESNKLLKEVHSQVLIDCKEFPNCRRKYTFIKGMLTYGQFYDSLVAAAKKDPKEKGYLAPEVVNQIILDLREVVKTYLDVDLKAVYSAFESKDNISNSEMIRLDEDFQFLQEYDAINEEEIIGRIADWMFGKKMGKDKPQKMTKTQSAKLQARSGEQDIESERMKTLASNKLPLILAGIGGALGALSWIAQTDWFKDLVTETIHHPAKYGEKTFTTVIEKNLKVDPNGWSYTIQNNGFMQSTGKSLNWNQPVGNLEQAFKFYGGGDVKKGIESMSNFLGPQYRGASVDNIVKQLADPSNKTVGDIFNHLEGTWGDKALMNQFGGAKTAIAKQLFKQTKRVLIKAGFTTTTTSVIGGKLISLAPILGTIGIALVGAGALFKLLRLKGQRQSRAKTLNDLLQSLQLVKVGGQTPVIDKDDDDNDEDEKEKKDKQEGPVIQEDDAKKMQFKFYVETKKLFETIIKLEEQISNKRVLIEDDEVLQSKVYKVGDHTLKPGETYIYTNSKSKNATPMEVFLISTDYAVETGKDDDYLTDDDVEKEVLKDKVVYVIPNKCSKCKGAGKQDKGVEIQKVKNKLIKVEKEKGKDSKEYKEVEEEVKKTVDSLKDVKDIPCKACAGKGKFEAKKDLDRAVKMGYTLEPMKVEYKDLQWNKLKLEIDKEYLYTAPDGTQKPVKVIGLRTKMKVGSDKKWNASKGDKLEPENIQVISKDSKGEYSSESTDEVVAKTQLSVLASDSFKENYLFTFESYVRNYYNLYEKINPVTGETKPGVGGISKNTPGFDKELTTPAVGRSNTNIMGKKDKEGNIIEKDAVAAWRKILKVYNSKDLKLTELVEELKVIIRESTERDKKWKYEEFDESKVVTIGKQVMENEATIGKPISFEELIRERLTVLQVSNQISVLSRIILGFSDDVGLAGAYGLAGDQIKNFIKIYNNIKEIYPKLI